MFIKVVKRHNFILGYNDVNIKVLSLIFFFYISFYVAISFISFFYVSFMLSVTSAIDRPKSVPQLSCNRMSISIFYI